MMRHSLLIAALTLTAIGGGAARADAYAPTGIEAVDGGAATSGRSPDAEAADGYTRTEAFKLAEMESEGRGHDDDDDDDDDDDGDDDDAENGAAGAAPGVPGSGAPVTAPAPKNPLLNGKGRPSVVVQ